MRNSSEEEDKLPLLSNHDPSIFKYDLAWSNVSCKMSGRALLDGCFGRVTAGEICAIIGPSGAGKTTLLNVLAGRKITDGSTVISGSVALGGKRIEPSKFRRRIAYVMQEDAHMKTVTPREALEFSAQLRLPNTVAVEDIRFIVSRTLAELGLESCADTMVGGGLIKGLSGGEKKRTSVGVEIITEPEILFLDEPTSGLDSYAAYSIVELLLQVARRGCTVLCTIHQPSSEVFELFDSVILLNQGRVLYQGPRTDIIPFFSKFGYVCPTNYNPADYALRLSQRESFDQLQKSGLIEANFMNSEMIRMEVGGYPTTTSNPMNSTQQAGFVKQLNLLTIREAQKVKRDKGALMAKFGIAIFLNLLYGFIFLSAGSKSDADPDHLQAHFGVIMMVSISSMFGSAQPIMLALPIERPMFLREYSTGTYSALSYFLSKTAVELPMTLLTTLLQWGIVYYLCGFNGDFLSIAMASFALSAASCSVALVLGSLVDDVKTASELQPLVFTPQLLFAGYFIRTSHIPSFLRWSEYLCSLKYAISLILLSEFDPNNINCQGEAAAACSSILTRNGIELESWRMYCFVLFAIFLGFRTIAAIVLVRRAKFFY